jgi:hypothetical protein
MGICTTVLGGTGFRLMVDFGFPGGLNADENALLHICQEAVLMNKDGDSMTRYKLRPLKRLFRLQPMSGGCVAHCAYPPEMRRCGKSRKDLTHLKVKFPIAPPFLPIFVKCTYLVFGHISGITMDESVGRRVNEECGCRRSYCDSDPQPKSYNVVIV